MGCIQYKVHGNVAIIFDIAYAHVESKAEESANKSTTVIHGFTMVVSFLSFKAAADSYFHTQPVVSLYK